MAYTKDKRFENFAYEFIMNDVLNEELTEEEKKSPFMEDVCPDTKINLKNHVNSMINFMNNK